MPTFPASLPPPALSTLSESVPNNTIRSNMDVGPAKVRRRTSANVRNLAFVLKLTPVQTAILDTFYNDTTFSGAVEFDYIHPRTSVSVKARFTDPPEYSEEAGVIYNCAINLEILP